jgi:acetoin utilization deacetylase AcuC-like enzyme
MCREETIVSSDLPILAFYDERTLLHSPEITHGFQPGRLARRVQRILAELDYKWDYPEHPGRVSAIRTYLEEHPIAGVNFRKGERATRTQLARVHTASYLDRIFELRGKTAWLDEDTTAISPKSVDAASVAAGTVIAAVEAVVAKEAQSAFAIVRPPGHHAEPTRARGFCLFNNIAVAASHAQAKLGCERVLIVDWDCHHGNGTQEIFWADPSVMLFDVHRAAPFYPGSGALEEIGAGLGSGYTVNVPLPVGTGDRAVVKAFEDILVPAAKAFEPDLVLVSAGFDWHRNDLGGNVTENGFATLTSLVQGIAARYCGGRIVFTLEGGYDLDSLSEGVHAVLSTLAGQRPEPIVECGMPEVEAAAEFHRDAFEDDDTEG